MVSDLIVAAKRDISKMFRRLPQQRAKPKPKPKPKKMVSMLQETEPRDFDDFQDLIC